ncbi:DUF3576 domain-containing protein [Woodsholea maritima]|uniref:DUF3576 domain-containing protein n=1 Tax=Woodsholea maritima TaxID=240237 RepID=UPI00037D8533|nr:DUF3576 domain-containing protein [Woodsholea maritima]
MTFERATRLIGLSLACAGLLAACSSKPKDEGRPSFFPSFGGSNASSSEPAEAGIGVNSYLWRASLDTLSFMPLSEVDPFGGVIITDWYANPEQPQERFKATVYILDTRLRADALSAQVFKQTRDAQGNWVDSAIDQATRIQIENAILTRARQLRIQNIN